MEKDNRPPSESSEESKADTSGVDRHTDPSIPQIQLLADSVDTIRLDTQAVDLESQLLESSSEKPEQLILQQNWQDLVNLSPKLVSPLHPSTNETELLPLAHEPVHVALLRAMLNMSTQREVGAALMQYMEFQRLIDNVHTHGSSRLLLSEKLVEDLTKIAQIELRGLTIDRTEKPDRDQWDELTQLRRNVYNCLLDDQWHNKYFSYRLIQRTFIAIAEQLFLKINESEKISTFEELQSASSNLLSTLPSCLKEPISWTRVTLKINDWVTGIIKWVRKLRSTCKEQDSYEVERATREVLLHAFDFAMILECVCYRDCKKYEMTPFVKKISPKSRIQHSTSLPVPVAGKCQSGVRYTTGLPSPPESEKYTGSLATRVGRFGSLIGAGATAGDFVGGQAMIAGPVAAGISDLGGPAVGATTIPKRWNRSHQHGIVASLVGGAAGVAGAAVGGMTAGLVFDEMSALEEPTTRRLPVYGEEAETLVKPGVTSGSHTPLACVAKPFSDPVYLRGGGSSGGGGGGGDGGSGGEHDEGFEGGDGGDARGRRMPDRDPTAEYNRQFVAACRSLSDAINDLCRITSQINGIQNDCREMINKLLIHEGMMHSGQPHSALSYPECVDELINLRESIALLNDDQPMTRIELFRSLRFAISVVCKSLDIACQCIYFLTLLEEDQKAAEVGVVDVKELKKFVKEAQFTCYKLLQLSDVEIESEAIHLWRQTDKLLAELTEASKRTLNKKDIIEDMRINVQDSVQSLSMTLDNTLVDRGERSAHIIRLLYSIKRVGALTEDPDIVPIAANTDEEARKRRQDVLKSAINLKNNATVLVNDAMALENLRDDSRTLTWDTGRDVVRGFEELMVAIRKNGRSAGYIEDELQEASADVPATVEPVSS